MARCGTYVGFRRVSFAVEPVNGDPEDSHRTATSWYTIAVHTYALHHYGPLRPSLFCASDRTLALRALTRDIRRGLSRTISGLT